MYSVKYKRSKIDLISLSSILYILPILIYFFKNNFIFYVLGICCTLFSYLYHITYEQIKVYLYLDMFFSCITLFYLILDIIYITFINFYLFLYYMILINISIYFYYKGCGRNLSIERTSDYDRYHLYWHISLFILSTSHSILN